MDFLLARTWERLASVRLWLGGAALAIVERRDRDVDEALRSEVFLALAGREFGTMGPAIRACWPQGAAGILEGPDPAAQRAGDHEVVLGELQRTSLTTTVETLAELAPGQARASLPGMVDGVDTAEAADQHDILAVALAPADDCDASQARVRPPSPYPRGRRQVFVLPVMSSHDRPALRVAQT